ncbi:MAG: thermonuclease family protein [Alphaproteobacteria bacterium]|nr:thermonuclease family protein [Alphaproteobacteria bacterium]
MMLRFLLLLLFMSVPALAQERAQESLPTTSFKDLKPVQTRRVLEVIDPLTVQLEGGQLYSLSGIEIPDFNPYNPGPITQTSMRVLKDMLSGAEVTIYQPADIKGGGDVTDRMGRHLAQIQKKEDGSWVQGTLLALGLARVKTERRTPQMAAEMLALEEQARNSKIGLWALPDYKILTPEETPEKKGSFQVVQGKVISTSMKQNRVYINFGNNWKDDFTVTIKPEFRSNFFKGKLDPLKLNGKTIRVRGWIEDYNGPFIEIDHPERIEVLKD